MAGFPKDKLHFGIFGPGLSGKTTLAKGIARDLWKNAYIKSLALDPNLEQWGRQTWVTQDEEKFWEMAWKKEQNCGLFVDEAAETIARDKEATPLFTRIRHRGHRLFVIGHDGTNLLPVQRNQIQTLFLFRQTERGAGLWAEEFTDDRILEATTLHQYEFLFCQLYKQPVRKRLRRDGSFS